MRTLLLSPLLLLFAACHVGARSSPLELAEERLAHGEVLFANHCAVCHGVSGRGDGVAARFLFPPARDFAAARFRLVSSKNGAPSADDLVATLTRGIPGSSMPAWSWLARGDLDSLADYVLFLAEQGLRQELEREAETVDDPLLLSEAPRIARARLTAVGEQPAPRPDARDETDETDEARLTHGRDVFLTRCAECHGARGEGQPDPRYDEDGTLNWARDFTAGFLKGGADARALSCRIRDGMPGTAMPPFQLAEADEGALLDYLQRLIPPGASERLVHRRGVLHAPRVAELPEDPDDARWSRGETLAVVLAPLWWSADAVLGAELAAQHDGTTLAVRLSWADATGVVQLFAEATTSDGAALQLSSAARPPLFGMGAEGEPTNLWHWQALRLEDVAGALDLLDTAPHALHPTKPGEVRADVPRYERLLARPAPSSRVDRIQVEGVETIAHAQRVEGEVGARASWHDGRWSVVFTRPLAVPGPEQVPLAPGARVQLACALWNGAAGDGGARKSISIWQELRLER